MPSMDGREKGQLGKPQEDLSFQTKHDLVKHSDVLGYQPKTNGKLRTVSSLGEKILFGFWNNRSQ